MYHKIKPHQEGKTAPPPPVSAIKCCLNSNNPILSQSERDTSASIMSSFCWIAGLLPTIDFCFYIVVLLFYYSIQVELCNLVITQRVNGDRFNEDFNKIGIDFAATED